LRDRYEAHHKVTITDSALVAAANLGDRYVNDRFLPDKAIDLIDEAGARLRIRRLTAPPERKEFDTRTEETRKKKEEAIDGEDFELGAALDDQEQQLKDERNEKAKAWRHGESGVVSTVKEEVIAEVLTASTGTPIVKQTEEESARLLNMEDELHKRGIGQD